MAITDDGCSFKVDRAVRARAGKCLGLLGMRERLEMVGGKLEIESAPGQGTTVKALIAFPLITRARRPRLTP